MKNLVLLSLTLLIFTSTAFSQTTEFTYQGRLTDNALPANTNYDFEFRLFDVETGGTPLGGIVETRSAVAVANGIFTVRLNFGAQFDGSPRWLGISVKPSTGTTFALLNPRQPLLSAPYSIKSLNSDTSTTSTNSTQLNGIPASQYVLTTDTRMTDARTPTAGSADYVQNRTTEQTGTNFNVAGNGTVGGVFTTSSGSAAAPSITFTGDTGTGLFRSAPGTLRFSTGGVARMVIDTNGRIGVGSEVNATPTRFFAVEDNASASNAFGIYGRATGAINTNGSRTGVYGVSFFPDAQAAGTNGYGVQGFASGATQNYGLVGNAFGAGTFNVGVYGSAGGATVNYAGFFSGNTFVGGAGIVRSYINSDSNAGIALTLNNEPGWSVATANTGHFQIYNDSIGQNAFWIDKTTNNTGIGTLTPNARLDVAGSINTSTQFNIGGNRTLSANGPYNDGISANSPASNTFTGVGAGSNTAPEPSLPGFFGKMNSFFGAGAGQANTTGYLNSFFGFQAGAANTTATGNAFFGQSAGSRNTGASNSFFGRLAGSNNVGGNSNTAVGENADFATNNATGAANTLLGSNTRVAVNTNSQTALGSASRVDAANSTAIGFRAYATQSNSLVLGSINGVNGCTPPFCDSVNVGIGTTAPTQRLHVVGSGLFTGDLTVNGTLNANLGGSYVQNGTAQQPSSNFNITGSGTASVFNATTQFNIAGNRILSNAGSSNLFAGVDAGTANTGFANAFFGFEAGRLNQNGRENTFVGAGAGHSNVSGSFNSFFGGGAGRDNTGTENSFFGYVAGVTTTSGSENAFFGRDAGNGNTTGSGNLFLGKNAGNTNTTGRYNTVVGYDADISTGDLTNAIAIGSRAFVSQSNSIVLGSISNINGCVSGFPTLCESARVGIGINAPSYRLHVIDELIAGLRVQTNGIGGTVASFGGNGAFQIDASGVAGGRFHVSESGNIGMGTNAPNDRLEVNGVLRVNSLGTVGGTQLCRNLSNQISNCSSSLRYKTNIAPFASGLSFINRLRPITFDWKAGGAKDVGFGAEDVARIDPRFVTYNDNGEVEGIKYDRIGVVAVNAIKEQQEQIDAQRRFIEAREKTNADLRKEVVELREKIKVMQAESEEMKKAMCTLLPALALCGRVER